MMVYEDKENSLTDCLNYVESFEIFENGNIEMIDFKHKKFNLILNKVKDLFCESRLMPAFGVSLHKETLNEMKNGSWLQINFSKQQMKNGLNFNSLLFKLEKTQGFNLIRLYENKYEGRCLYLDLNCEIDLNSVIN